RENWVWRPAGPGAGQQTLSVVIPAGKKLWLARDPAGKTVALPQPPDDTKDGGYKAVSGTLARIWAEADWGPHIVTHLKEDLVLVSEVDPFGVRRYQAAQMETFTYNFNPTKGTHTFHDRAVRVRNDTSRPLVLHGKTLYEPPGGKAKWLPSKDVTVPPGKTVVLRRTEDNWVLRGSKAHLWASQEGKEEHFRWHKFKSTAVPQVDANGYQREDYVGSY